MLTSWPGEREGSQLEREREGSRTEGNEELLDQNEGTVDRTDRHEVGHVLDITRLCHHRVTLALSLTLQVWQDHFRSIVSYWSYQAEVCCYNLMLRIE